MQRSLFAPRNQVVAKLTGIDLAMLRIFRSCHFQDSLSFAVEFQALSQGQEQLSKFISFSRRGDGAIDQLCDSRVMQI